MPQDIRAAPSILTVPDAPTDPDAFLRWAKDRPLSEGRYELSKGVVSRMKINVTRRHAQITSNMFRELSRLLDPDSYLITSADYGVRTPHGIRGPDIMVETIEGDAASLATEKPILLAEVLSPSTAGIDFTEKRDEYLAIASLRAYLVCASDEPRVWAWRRTAGGSWPATATMFESRPDAVAIAGLDIDLTLAAIYRGI